MHQSEPLKTSKMFLLVSLAFDSVTVKSGDCDFAKKEHKLIIDISKTLIVLLFEALKLEESIVYIS